MSRATTYSRWVHSTNLEAFSPLPPPSPSHCNACIFLPRGFDVLWQAAVNIMRSLALSRATGSRARPLLLLSCSSLSNRHDIVRAFLSEPAVGKETGGDYVADSSEAHEAGRSNTAGLLRQRQRQRRWLLILARFMAKPREYEQRRAALVRTFTPQKFRQEWELFWELLDPMFEAVDRTSTVRSGEVEGLEMVAVTAVEFL